MEPHEVLEALQGLKNAICTLSQIEKQNSTLEATDWGITKKWLKRVRMDLDKFKRLATVMEEHDEGRLSS